MAGKSPKKRGKSLSGGSQKKQKAAVVSADDDGVFFEAEAVVDARKTDAGVWEYRVRWKGFKPSDDTWEPECNLCDSLYHYARAFKRKVEDVAEPDIFQEEDPNENEPLLLLEEDSESDKDSQSGKESFTRPDVSCDSEDDDSKVNNATQGASDHWKWTDKEQVNFREIERIDVNDADVRRRVTDARVNGVPVVLVGHPGWSQFARSWLKEKGKTEEMPKLNCEDVTAQAEADKAMTQTETGVEATQHVNVEENRVDAANPTSQQTKDKPAECTESSICVESIAEESNQKENMKDFPPSTEMLLNGAESTAKMQPAETKKPYRQENEKALETNIMEIRKSVDLSREALERDANGPTAVSDSIDCIENKSPPPATADVSESEWLDLAKEWEIDIHKMIEDVGDEEVPVVRLRYNEQNPIHRHVRLSQFLKRCWPSGSPDDAVKNVQRLYLHQWQFPLSEANSKLCGAGRHNPLPNDIIGEDLLCYWHDKETCRGDNPYQYIFMGREKTMSKLHRDAGGLAISIAPIVGQKEVVMVHRSDGTNCTYHLKANLDKIDLHKHPLLCYARIYKTTVNPGEILLMPQGTFHQCRNVTPCLSYHRFHLDAVNLRAFLESMLNEDAPEIEHEEVLWNASIELQRQLDKFLDEMKMARKRSSTTLPNDVPGEFQRKVDALRALRHVCREIGRRYEEADRIRNAALVRGQPSNEADTNGSPDEAGRWGQLVRDIDSTLHDFRYRYQDNKPPFRPRTGRRDKSKSNQSMERMPSHPSNNKVGLEVALSRLPEASDLEQPLPDTTTLSTGIEVEVTFQGRRVKGVIKHIEAVMQAAFMVFEDLPSVYNEFLPLRCLRMPVSGESVTEVRPEDVTPGKLLVYKNGEEEYRGVVKSLQQDTFYQICLKIGKFMTTRWLPRNKILRATPMATPTTSISTTSDSVDFKIECNTENKTS